MAIITISRQIGSFGDEIAESAAKKLKYTLIDKYAIHQMMEIYSSDFSAELKDLSEENQPGFFSRIFRHQAVYVNLISSLIYEAAGGDNVIIQGHGGQFLLSNRPNVLNVRVIAPLALRVTRIQERQNLNPEIAGEIVRRNDRDRSGFIHYLYQKDVANPEWYDIIFNTAKFDKQLVVDMIVQKAVSLDQEHPMSETYRNRFMALALRKRVEAILQKEMPNSNHIKVEADADGTVRISGYIGTEIERLKAEEITKGVPGVQSLVTAIHVAHFPVTSWP